MVQKNNILEKRRNIQYMLLLCILYTDTEKRDDHLFLKSLVVHSFISILW